MALIKCHECGGNVSTEADACPHCGAKPGAAKAKTVKSPPPTKQPPAIVRAGAILLVIAAMVAYLNSVINEDKNSQSESQSTACAKDDLKCLGDAASIAAGIYCKKPIEQLAKHAVRWTDGTFETKFSRVRWADQSVGSLTLVGDKAEFQNGFGAYTPVIYECDLASDQKTVLDVRVREGRM